MSKLAEWLSRAGEACGLSVEVGFTLPLGEGRKLNGVALVRGGADRHGMIVFNDYADMCGESDQIIAMEYGYSCIPEPPNTEEFDLESFKEMFADWGWVSEPEAIGLVVYLYRGSGRFIGDSVWDWARPSVGAEHKFILFLAQRLRRPLQEIAEVELAKFGFAEVHLEIGKPLDAAALNQAQMHKFHKHYEGALSEGSSLVWYP